MPTHSQICKTKRCRWQPVLMSGSKKKRPSNLEGRFFLWLLGDAYISSHESE